MGWEYRLNGEIKIHNTDQKIRKKMIVFAAKESWCKNDTNT
jgi:hypothetical protein